MKFKLPAPALGAAAAVLSLFGATNAGQAAENILYNCFHPPQYYTCAKVLPEMGRRIEEATEGRVTLTIPPKSLASPLDQLDGVTNGVMDGATSYTGFLRGETAGLRLTILPFLGRHDAAAASRALYETFQKFFAGKPGEFENVELVGVYVINGSDFWSLNDTPIQSVKDITDRKMFAVAGSAANVIKATGSSVVAGPAVQMLESISRGVVDGYAGVTWDALAAFKLGQYTKSGTFTDRKITQPSFGMFINKDKWAKISPKDQQAIRDVLGADFSQWIGEISNTLWAAAREKLSADGVKSFEASAEFEAELIKLSAPAVDAWKEEVKAKGIDGDAAIAYFQQAYEKALAMSMK